MVMTTLAWSWSLRTLDSPNHDIIDDDHAKVSLYLANLKMLWGLGVNLSARGRTEAWKGPFRLADRLHLPHRQKFEIVRSTPRASDEMDVGHVEAFFECSGTN